MADAVRRGQRWTEERPCPICGGWDRMPRGKGTRCSGYLGTDGKFAHCAREELAQGLQQEAGGTFAHRLEGECRCGKTHGDAPIADLGAARAQRSNGEAHVIRELIYDYEGGLRVVRRDLEGGDKTFTQWHRNGAGYKAGRGEAPLTLYRAPELRETPIEAFVFFVEGEKCVEALRRNALCAVTTPGGAKAFKGAAARAAELMTGRHVVVLPDHDAPGEGLAKDALDAFLPVAASLRRLDLPGLEDGEDVVDWLAHGGDIEDLVRMAEARADLVEAQPGRIHWISTSQIFEPLPPTHWLFQELGMCPGRPSMLAGYGYSGKTLAGQSMLLSAAAGLEAWGHFPTGKPQRVRHFDFEQGRHATLKRYQRLAAGMDLAIGDLGGRLEVTIFPPAPLNAKDAADVYARQSENVDLVFIDALAGATPGEAENDSTMRGYIDMLGRVSEKTGAMFQLVHHAGKPKDVHNSDARTLVRGHSAIFDACGSVLVFVGEKNGPVLVKQVKAPAEAEGQAIPNFYLQIEDVIASAGYGNGVKVTHKAAEDQSQEKKAERENATEASKAARMARIGRDVPEKMELIWSALCRVKNHSITTRKEVEGLVDGDTNVKQLAVTRLLAGERIRRVKEGKERWFEAV